METKSFGQWLRHRRRELDLTQEELAHQVGCAPITIRKIEAEAMRPSKQLAGLLGEHLGVPASERGALVQFARGGEPLPSQAPEVPKDNLPHPISSFIGREREIAEIQRMLSESRLVTLTGAGGCGKSRLAIEAAARIVDRFPEGVWFVAFASVSDLSLIPQTIAAALRVRESPGRSLMETLCVHLGPQRTLLILDNCEHLIGACAQAANALLECCPELRILTTSREALGIEGEERYYVPGLSLPETGPGIAAGGLNQSEAVRLFVERGTLAQPGFSLREANSGPIVDICRRLDGMPLAIELAAARVKVLSVQHIAERLDDRFSLLTGGSRTAPPRHQTLRATIDWSYELLPEKARLLFARLSVFAGGFTQDAAQAVSGEEAPGSGQVLAELSSLVDRSLVEVVDAGEDKRYRMLESVRQYAQERLGENGEEASIRERHLRFFTEWLEEIEPTQRGPEQIACWERIEKEHDNVRAALEWSLSTGNIEWGLRLAGATFRFWYVRGYIADGLRWPEALLGKTSPEVRTWWRAKMLSQPDLLWDREDFAAVRAAAEEALGIWRELGDGWWTACTLVILGWLPLYQGDADAALHVFQEAVSVARGLDDQWVLARALKGLGAAITRRDLAEARPVLEESIAIWREIGDKVGLADALQQMGGVAYGQKDYDRAASLYEESLALLRETGEKSYAAMVLMLLGFTRLRQAQKAEALQFFVASLTVDQEMGLRPGVAENLLGLGGVACSQRQFERAARLLGAAAVIFESTGLKPSIWPRTMDDFNAWTSEARSHLGAATFEARFAEGRSMTLQEAVRFALEGSENG